MQDEYLTRVVIDPSARSFYLYSSEGGSHVVDCTTMDEFMNVMSFIRSTAPDEAIAYANPL
jgi:hypothetical protein|tara:strand:- start:309 stop:491 length:183 start_codon:yes stop_codon:yes gene_type:complete